MGRHQLAGDEPEPEPVVTSAEYDIEVERGADLRLDVVPKHGDETVYDLTGATASMGICLDGQGPIVLAVGPEPGTIHVHLTPAVTSQIEARTGYTIDVHYPGGDIGRLLHGDLRPVS